MIVLDLITSGSLRSKYIEVFVNTTSTYYKKNIEQKKPHSDGLCYSGYLWDCLQKPTVISEHEADLFLREKKRIYIIWDIHSLEKFRYFTAISKYWKYPKDTVLLADTWLDTIKDELPEDVYIFDDTFSWSIIYTHETNLNNDRYCVLAKRQEGDKGTVCVNPNEKQ